VDRTILSMLHRFCARIGVRLARLVAFGSDLIRLAPRFTSDSRANVAMIFAIVLIPITFAAGMGVDYTMAARRQTKLDAAADAAALAAVTPAMLSQSQSAAQTAAQNMFNAQASIVPGVSSIVLTVAFPSSGQSVSSSSVTRTVTVSYTAKSQTAFAGIIGQKTINIAGGSKATASTAPNINFYVLADSSPSMAIPATTAGINAIISATTNAPSSGANAGGCAFACHESNPSADNLGNPGGEDNYALAKTTLGLTLRIDNLRTAIENLASTASATEASDNATYDMAIYTFDTNFNIIENLTSNMNTASTQASNISLLEVYDNNWLTSSDNNSDTDTNSDNALSSMNSIMPNPGNGTNVRGDSPQEVLFFVTDGVEDEMVSGSRQQSLMTTSECTTIKNRGIRIAVLYTTYLPLNMGTTGDPSWYATYIAPFQSQIGPNLQSCASPGLYQEVDTDQDISTALATLFINAVATAHLTQ